MNRAMMTKPPGLAPIPAYIGAGECIAVLIVAMVAWWCVPGHFELAGQYIAAGQIAQASRLLENALSRTKDSGQLAQLNSQLADVALLRGDVKTAINLSRRAVDRTPDSLRLLVKLADQLEMSCQPREAMEILGRAVDVHRKWRESGRPDVARMVVGLSLLSPGDRPSMRLLAERLDEWFLPHRKRLAWYQRHYQKLDAALATHRAIVVDFPRDAATWDELSRLEAFAGHEKESRDALSRVVALRPLDRSLRDRLAMRFELGRMPDEAAEQIVLARIEGGQARDRVLRAYVRAGRTSEAISAYAERFPGDSDRMGIHLDLARVLTEEGDSIEAIRVLERASVLFPRQEQPRRSLARLLLDVGRFVEASRMLKELIRSSPSDLKLRSLARESLEASDQTTEAIEQLTEMHRLDAGDRSVTRDLGLALARAGRFAEADPLLARVSTENPRDQMVLFEYARTRGELGSPQEGIERLNRLLRVMGVSPSAAARKPSTPSEESIGPTRRRVLALFKRSDGDSSDDNLVHKRLEMILNHMGAVVDFRDAESALPTDREMVAYRGIVTWFATDRMRGAARYAQWLTGQVKSGIPALVMERLGCETEGATGVGLDRAIEDRLFEALGYRIEGSWVEDPNRVEVVLSDPAVIGFERPMAYEKAHFLAVKVTDPSASVLLRLRRKDRPDLTSDAIHVGPRGGFCLDGYALHDDLERHRDQWRLDPFALVERALRLAALPKLDFTTREGARMFYVHVDGDGSNQPAAWLPNRTCAELFLSRVVERYRYPMTVSFIGCLVDPAAGIGSGDLQAARAILANPRVEGAHHSYSHPFDWRMPAPGLKISGYPKVDLRREVVEVKQLIDSTLSPPGRPISMCLWSGEANPSREALRLCQEAGMLNMNGGLPRLDPCYDSVLHVPPPTNLVGGLIHYNTSAANDYAITDNWRYPPIAFTNVLHTFARTEWPRRLLPVDVYFHFYLLATEGGCRALDEIFDWVRRQMLHPVTAGEYVRSVDGFLRARISRNGPRTWTFEEYGDCRTVRFDRVDETVDWIRSKGVLGCIRKDDSLYVHLVRGTIATVTLSRQAAAHPHLAFSTASVIDATLAEDRVEMELRGDGRHVVKLAGLSPESRWRVRRSSSSAIQTSAATKSGEIVLEIEMQGTLRVMCELERNDRR